MGRESLASLGMTRARRTLRSAGQRESRGSRGDCRGKKKRRSYFFILPSHLERLFCCPVSRRPLPRLRERDTHRFDRNEARSCPVSPSREDGEGSRTFCADGEGIPRFARDDTHGG